MAFSDEPEVSSGTNGSGVPRAAAGSVPQPDCRCGSHVIPRDPFGSCNFLALDRVPILSGHAGKGGPDLLIRWNGLGPDPQSVDVVVHLHGHLKCRSGQNPRRIDLCSDILSISGLDFSDPEGKDHAAGRVRPTVVLLPRGNYTGTDGGTGYDFPALAASGGLTRLIEFAVGRLRAELKASHLRTGRLILTAHSGGGHDLQRILAYADPHEVHIFDALYSRPEVGGRGLLEGWAAGRIHRDLSSIGSSSPARYMAEEGGALRVISLTTPTYSDLVGGALKRLIPPGSPLEKRYRVEYTCGGHCTIPRRFGWRLLTDPGADLPGVNSSRQSCRKPTRPPAHPAAPRPAPALAPAAAGLRQKIVAVAEREWRNWGQGTLRETAPAATPLLSTYYRQGVRQSPADSQLQDRSWQARHPWSAVFVSYVMREAGAADSFGYSPSHTGYVAVAKKASARHDATRVQAFRIDQVSLEPGDVVCHDRVVSGGKCAGTNFDNVESLGSSHGEIVVEVHPGYAVTVGGNTSQEFPKKGLGGDTVGKHSVWLDSRGMIAAQGKCAYFAVLKPPAPAGTQPEISMPAYRTEAEEEVPLASAKSDYSLQALAQQGMNAAAREFLDAILVRGENDAAGLTNRVFWKWNPQAAGQTLSNTDPRQSRLRLEWSRIYRTRIAPLIWLRQMIHELDKHRGSIPREFLLGWMAVESDGNVKSRTPRGELGYFQIDWKAGEAREQLGMTREDFDRLYSDRSYSVQKGVELVIRYRKYVLDHWPEAASDPDLVLRLTKGRHAMPAAVERAVKALRKAGGTISWNTLAPLLPSGITQNIDKTMHYAAQLKPLAELVPDAASSPGEIGWQRNPHDWRHRSPWQAN
ncbi:MAG TPA: DUF2272 domain-containing protein [Bryobacteraceae bacterium]|nr:DUF2272 domain-containing protein [Bryobacteraceae bacterium]